MIFVTVGVQLPFDRLIQRVDHWAQVRDAAEPVFAQIGTSAYQPKNINFSDFLDLREAEGKFKECSLIVAHAGVGSILSALKYKKPLIVMPRLAKNHEHRNDHQLATAKWAGQIKGVNVAWDGDELVNLLQRTDALISGDLMSNYASEELLDNLKHYFQKK